MRKNEAFHSKTYINLNNLEENNHKKKNDSLMYDAQARFANG